MALSFFFAPVKKASAILILGNNPLPAQAQHQLHPVLQLNAFPPEDPSTPNIDESLTIEGFTTYGILNAGNWEYDAFDEDGSFTVTSCNASTTLISGTFQTTLTDLINNMHIVKITAGRVNNVKYTVLN